jgi:hypothetical protein
MSTLKGVPFKQQKNMTRRTVPVPLEPLVYVIRMSCCKSTTEIVTGSVPHAWNGGGGAHNSEPIQVEQSSHISPPIATHSDRKG